MRKLAIGAFSFSAAIFISNYILPDKFGLLPAIVFALAAVLLIVFRAPLVLRILSVSLCLGFSCFFVNYLSTGLPAERLCGENVELQAKIIDYPVLSEDYCRVEVKLIGDGVPTLRTLVYHSGTFLAEAEPGQYISFTASLSPADRRYGADYGYYQSRDIYLIANAQQEMSLYSVAVADVSMLPVRIKHAIASTVDEIFPSDTAPFMKSLMLGDRSDLYKDKAAYTDMSRAGIMHIVAVSGLHISFLVTLLQFLLGRGKISSLLCIALVWGFVLVTGCTPSAVRAGFMQTMLLMAPLLRRENDPLTSVGAALAFILFCNPYAAGNVSLQLSFAAILGLTLVGEKINDLLLTRVPEGLFGKLIAYVLQIVSSSAAVSIFTLPLMAVHFGYISVLAPVSNILAMWAVSLSFIGGYASAALGMILPQIGEITAWMASWPVRYILLVVRLISDVPLSVVYMNTVSAVLWLVFCYLQYALAAFSKMKLRYKLLLPTLLSGLMLAGSQHILKRTYLDAEGYIIVHDVGQGQCISAFSDEATVMIDCGSILTLDNAGDVAGAYLLSRGRDKIDLLILTHLHADHCNGVTTLLELIDVDMIMLAERLEDEDDMLEEIRRSALAHGTQLVFIDSDKTIDVGAIALRLFAPVEAGGVNERSMLTKLSIDGIDMLVTGDVSSSAEKEFVAKTQLAETELLIVGHHGSRYSSSGALLDAVGGDTAIISVGYNSFGHPSQEALERLDAYGYNVYRTDLNGTIEIRID